MADGHQQVEVYPYMSRPTESLHFQATPHAVAATLISVVTELGCQLRSIDDFGTSVTFARPAAHGGGRPSLLTASVGSEDAGCTVVIRTHDLPGESAQGDPSPASLLDALAARLAVH